jgi:hypothetical protein
MRRKLVLAPRGSVKKAVLVSLVLFGLSLIPVQGHSAAAAIRSCDVYCPLHPGASCTCPLYTERASNETSCGTWGRSCWLE